MPIKTLVRNLATSGQKLSDLPAEDPAQLTKLLRRALPPGAEREFELDPMVWLRLPVGVGAVIGEDEELVPGCAGLGRQFIMGHRWKLSSASHPYTGQEKFGWILDSRLFWNS